MNSYLEYLALNLHVTLNFHMESIDEKVVGCRRYVLPVVDVVEYLCCGYVCGTS